MAKMVIQRLVDDMDGGDADESVRFSLDGTTYEIDLSGANAAKLRATLAPYIEAGSQVGKGGLRPAKTGPSMAEIKYRRMLVRAFWRDNRQVYGLPSYSDRGRIPTVVSEAYEEHQRRPRKPQSEAELPEPDQMQTSTGAAMVAVLKAAKPRGRAATSTKPGGARKSAVPAAPPEAGTSGKVAGKKKAPARKAASER